MPGQQMPHLSRKKVLFIELRILAVNIHFPEHLQRSRHQQNSCTLTFVRCPLCLTEAYGRAVATSPVGPVFTGPLFSVRSARMRVSIAPRHGAHYISRLGFMDRSASLSFLGQCASASNIAHFELQILHSNGQCAPQRLSQKA